MYNLASALVASATSSHPAPVVLPKVVSCPKAFAHLVLFAYTDVLSPHNFNYSFLADLLSNVTPSKEAPQLFRLNIGLCLLCFH